MNEYLQRVSQFGQAINLLMLEPGVIAKILKDEN